MCRMVYLPHVRVTYTQEELSLKTTACLRQHGLFVFTAFNTDLYIHHMYYCKGLYGRKQELFTSIQRHKVSK